MSEQHWARAQGDPEIPPCCAEPCVCVCLLSVTAKFCVSEPYLHFGFLWFHWDKVNTVVKIAYSVQIMRSGIQMRTNTLTLVSYNKEMIPTNLIYVENNYVLTTSWSLTEGLQHVLDCVFIGTVTMLGVCRLPGNLTAMKEQQAFSLLLLEKNKRAFPPASIDSSLYAKLTIQSLSYIFNTEIWHHCCHLTQWLQTTTSAPLSLHSPPEQGGGAAVATKSSKAWKIVSSGNVHSQLKLYIVQTKGHRVLIPGHYALKL